MIAFNDFMFPTFKESAVTDVRECEENFIIEVRAVGVTKDELEIKTERDCLLIKSSDKFGPFKDRFNLRYTLPVDVDQEGITASLENGILTVLVPKKQGTEAKLIEVK